MSRRRDDPIERLVDRIVTKVDAAESSPLSAHDSTRSRLEVLVKQCGAVKRSERLLVTLHRALLARGIYADPPFVDLRLPLDSWIRFSRTPPTTDGVVGPLFPTEYCLEQFIVENARHIDGLRDLDVVGNQFQLPLGRVDVLARDRTTGEIVVVEVKKAAPDQRVVAQMVSYLQAVAAVPRLNTNGVRGLIVSGMPDPQLQRFALDLAAQAGFKLDWAIYRVTMSLALE